MIDIESCSCSSVSSYLGAGAYDTQCPAGVNHVLQQTCEEWAGCPFLITCPIGQKYGCMWQSLTIAGILLLRALSLIVYIYRGCRRPRGGSKRLDLRATALDKALDVKKMLSTFSTTGAEDDEVDHMKISKKTSLVVKGLNRGIYRS